MSRGFGRFFQLSKGGGTTAFLGEVRVATNRELLKAVATGLEAAAGIGVTDPQGFLTLTGSPPLCFIDVHFTGKPNPGTFEDLLLGVRNRLEELD